MKVIKFLAAILVFVMAGCSDEPNGSLDASQYVQSGRLIKGTKSISCATLEAQGATYASANTEYFVKKDDGLWEEAVLSGSTTKMPINFVLKEGACWEYFSPGSLATGPTQYDMALSTLEVAMNKDLDVYTKKPVSIDESNATFTIGARTFDILCATDRMFALAESHKHLEVMCIRTYSLAEPLLFDDSALAFESERAAYNWLIDLFRARFGESVNRNNYTGTGAVSFTQPILKLEDIIAERDRLFPEE